MIQYLLNGTKLQALLPFFVNCWTRAKVTRLEADDAYRAVELEVPTPTFKNALWVS